MIRVLADLHHNDLFFSLHALFEKRLGWELYHPVGLDWFRQGFWKIAEPYGNAPNTIEQYLGIGGGPADLYSRLNGEAVETSPGVYAIPDPGHPGTVHKGITLEAFKATPFDLIVSTYGPPHDEAYDLLQRLYQPKARRMAQMGNWKQTTTCKHVLHSSPYEPTPGQHALHYHQEIDRALYPAAPIEFSKAHPESRRITSMVNLLPERAIYDAFKAALPEPEVRFRAFGASCPNGPLGGAVAVAPEMRRAHLGWHIKPYDGFGHTAMGWMASGRAVVTRMDEVHEYGLDAPRLFVPGETCVAIQGWDVAAGVTKIRRALAPDELVRMGAAAAARFAEICDYDAEEASIREFLAGVMA